MIVVKLKGGLGNQMFQYAVAKALSLKNKTSLRIDKSSFEDYKLHDYGLNHFNIDTLIYNKIPTLLRKVNNKLRRYKSYDESQHSFRYNKDLQNLKAYKLFLDGYFQCEQYFDSYRKEILEVFKITSPLKGITKQILQDIEETNSVSLHVRRGDYLLHEFHNTDKSEYYLKAMEYIESKVDNPVYYMFSDDIEWVKQNFTSKHKMIFVDFNNAETNYEDLKLMSHCKHNIIANSSFSWWGAWLNTNTSKIVTAPKSWFNDMSLDYTDVIPKSWITF